MYPRILLTNLESGGRKLRRPRRLWGREIGLKGPERRVLIGIFTRTKNLFQYCYAAICETTVRVAEIVKQRLLSCSDDDDYQPNLVCAIGVIS